MPRFIKVIIKGANYPTLYSILKAHSPEPEHPPSGDHTVDHTEGATLHPDHQTMFMEKHEHSISMSLKLKVFELFK